ncbi:MAG TPA: hypothetical protein VGZ25_07925, partial [Gemmataceae bacterium]|nr:hypothetical protein [Gemmataceae bacterium]
VWDGSGKTVNPRYLYGCYLFINRLNLLEQNDGIYRLGECGRKFLAHDEAILRELDAIEGIPKLLSLVAAGMVRLSEGRFTLYHAEDIRRHVASPSDQWR